jgi:hypothetical protein
MIKTRRIRLAGHLAHMGEKRNAYRILAVSLEGERELADLDVGGWTILKWILER